METIKSKFVRHDQSVGTGYLIDILERDGEFSIHENTSVSIHVYKAVQYDDETVEVEQELTSGPQYGDRDGGYLYLDGYMNRDGCSDWSIETPHNALHFCGPNDSDEFSWLMRECYNLARECMNWTEFSHEPKH